MNLINNNEADVMPASAVKTKNTIRARNLKNTWHVLSVVTIVSLPYGDDICRKKISFGDHPNIWGDLTYTSSDD